MTRKDVRYFKRAIMKERYYMTFRRYRSHVKINTDEHGQDGHLKVLIINHMLFKIVNWKIYSIRHINLFTDTSLIDNNLCLESLRAFCVVIWRNLANMLDKRGFQSVQYHCHVTCCSVQYHLILHATGSSRDVSRPMKSS